MNPPLKATLFMCHKCNMSKSVETRGEVISGPFCPHIRKARDVDL